MNHRINDRACERLARGILAVKRLDKLGCIVLGVDVRCGETRLTVLHDGSTHALGGTVIQRVTEHGWTICTHAATVEDCQVTWDVRHAPDVRAHAPEVAS